MNKSKKKRSFLGAHQSFSCGFGAKDAPVLKSAPLLKQFNSYMKSFLNKTLFPEEGIALMLTLWIMVLLIAMVTEFTHATRTEIKTTKNFKEEIECYYLAEAGINLAITEILQDAVFHTLDDDDEIVFGRKNFNEILQDTENQAVKDIGTPDNAEVKVPRLVSSRFRKDITLGNGSFSYSIIDDNGKLNLNLIPRGTIVKILQLSGLEEGNLRDTIADSILDWKDPDSLHHFNGAEDDYYATLSPPYESKDAPFETVEELLWVKGMSEEIFYGTENVKNNKDSGGNFIGIHDILTVQNIEFINPNTADERVLEILFPPDKVEAILTARFEKGLYDNSKSSHFIVESTGILNHSATRRTIKATFEKIGVGVQSFLVIRQWNDNKIN